VWLATFKDTVRSVSVTTKKTPKLGSWSGPLPEGIARSSAESEIELPKRGNVIVSAGYARGQLVRFDARSTRAASALKPAPKVSPTWQQVAATVGLSRSDPKVVTLMLQSPRELGLKRNDVHLRQGPVLVMKGDRVAEARLHIKPWGYSGAWKGSLPPSVQLVRPPGAPAAVKLDGMVLSYGARKLETITFR